MNLTVNIKSDNILSVIIYRIVYNIGPLLIYALPHFTLNIL